MSFFNSLKRLAIGKAKNPEDKKIFHQMSLIAFFAWVGLGADGLSSSCYGPEEAFRALGEHQYLGIFVAILTAITVFLISASYSQIIELFPNGGGGYLVASKLLNPHVGMISGCALLIDYVLTIAISIASASDALFSFLPAEWHSYRLGAAVFGVLLLLIMNMRGVKESVVPLTPIFLTFVITHCFAIGYSIFTHAHQVPDMVNTSVAEIGKTSGEVGVMGLIFIILRAYSLGAGTFTGIEAVSNGLPILREPKAVTGKMTMRYMSISLALTVAGLMVAYLLLNVSPEPNKTLNAVLMENIASTWANPWGQIFILVTLISEAMLLFVAAQTGFVDGPRVLANMAVDRWMPSKFASLSDRLVTQNGIILMGLAALITVIATKGSVGLLVVLYSINVFITFCLSQAGMVRHWWEVRKEERQWIKKIGLNGLGLMLTTFILISVIVLKFHDGGWATLLITGGLVGLAIIIKQHYRGTLKMLERLNVLVETAASVVSTNPNRVVALDTQAKTAAILVNGFNGLGLHTVMGVIRNFGKEFKNFVFIEVGVLDAGNFKGAVEVDSLKASVKNDLDRYIEFMNSHGFYAEKFSAFGTEIIAEAETVAKKVSKRFPGIIFFGGQLVFAEETFMNRLLHNYTVFSIQKRFYQQGIPFVILPIRV
ncbi:MAG: APC family permease [Candidatus Omnitrophica bacterium]|nr:APC family permease [Candidatus Omnitrophota bacterium]